MTRKKVTLSWIVNDSARKASLKKRRVGLLKKVSELSTLCAVSASVIIYSPEDRQPMMWPSRPEVQEMLARFHNMPEMERSKKLMNQESYLKERVSKVEEQFKKHQRKHKEMEASNLMHYIHQRNGLDEISVNDLHSLVWFVEEKRKEIKKRVEYYQQAPLSPAPASASAPHQSPAAVTNQMAPNIEGNIGGSDHYHHGKAPGKSALWDQWFTDIMNNTENTAGSSNRAKPDHMAGFSAPYQPFPASSTYYGTGIALGLQTHGGFSGSNMAIGLSAPNFERSGSGSGIALGLQPYGNVRANDSSSGGDHMGQPSEIFGDSIAGSDVGLSYDVNKPWPSNFFH
ncbi:hypothetical protein ACOSQ2_029053 [Xanthoceras sorbifolium]